MVEPPGSAAGPGESRAGDDQPVAAPADDAFRTTGRFGWTPSAVQAHPAVPAVPESTDAPAAVDAVSAHHAPESPTVHPDPRPPPEPAVPRRGCLLVGIAGAAGALVGALTAGLLLVIVLAGDNRVSSGGDGVADANNTVPTEHREPAEVLADALAEVTPPEGSTGDADFWSQVLADSDLFSGITSGESGTQSGDGELDLSPGVLADVWARMLTGASDEPGAPLGSRIEGINVKAVLEEVQESVVIVKTPTEENPDAGGSGFVVASDGHIVTNEHVVRDAELVGVRLFGGELLPAEVVASDPTRDLAVLKINRAGLQAVRLGSSEGVEVGDEVIAIGNAFGIDGEPTVTAGIVSGLNRHIDFPDRRRLVRLIQTDAAINPGNSGGPLVNAAGEVIGVNTAIRSGFAEGIGYAISIDHARPIIDQLIEGIVQARAFFGVSLVSVDTLIEWQATQGPPDLEDLGDARPETVEPGQDTGDEPPDVRLPPGVTSGAVVVVVVEGEAADAAGIVVGDVIVAFNGVRIETSLDLVTEILALVPGDAAEVTLIGPDGTQRVVEVTLGSFPTGEER